MSQKRNILFIYSNLGDGGTQRQRSILSQELCKDYDLYIAIFQNIQLFPFHGEVIDIDAPTSGNPLISIYNLFKRIVVIKRLIKRLQVDIIFSSSMISNMVCLLVKFLYRVKPPLVITFNNSLREKAEDMGLKGSISLFLNKRLIKYADKIITVSRALEHEIIEMGFPREKTITIYNGIAFDEMEEKSKERIDVEHAGFFNPRVPVIISVGRLTKQKNYGGLLDAFAKLRESVNARLVLIGDGTEKNYLLDKSLYLGIDKDDLLTGWVKNPYKYLKKSSIFVLSSLWEGFPNVVIEAMGMGLPVISTDCPTGPSEIITHGKTGILIPVDDTNELYEQMMKMMKNEKVRTAIAKNGRKNANNFAINVIAQKYDALFKTILERS